MFFNQTFYFIQGWPILVFGITACRICISELPLTHQCAVASKENPGGKDKPGVAATIFPAITPSDVKFVSVSRRVQPSLYGSRSSSSDQSAPVQSLST